VTETHDSEPAWLTRILRPFYDVHPGEAVTAALLTLNVFLLLTAYYVLKPLREELILAMKSGAEYKSWISGAIALLLFGLVPLYGKLVDRLPRSKLVISVCLAFALQLLVFRAFVAVPSAGARALLGLLFFVWVGVFNVMVVAQFWGYANDLYQKEQGDRLFPMVALGASVGAALGTKVAKFLINGLGKPSMLLVAALLLAACAGLFWLVERREGRPTAALSAAGPAINAGARRGGFALVVKYRYLLLIAAFSLIYNWVNSNGEYMLSKLITKSALAALPGLAVDDERVGKFIGAAYADFYFYVNVSGVLLQSFVVSRLVRWFKLPSAFLFLPLIALGNAFIFAFVPIVALAKTGKTAENATDYSLNNTLKQMLWLVTSADMKYKAKQVVDTFCVRIGDVCSALSVFVAANVLKLSVPSFAWISIALAGVWLVLAVAIGRLYRGFEEQKEALGT
jgi:ATP:ADP antiporter, AAA family